MSKLYDISLRVAADTVSTIIKVIEGSGELLSVNPVSDDVPRKGAFRVAKHRNSKTGRHLALEQLKGGHKRTYAQLLDVFVKDGRAHNSISPVTSLLQADKLISAVEPRVFQITPAGAKALEKMEAAYKEK
jgi:hypothetical protein